MSGHVQQSFARQRMNVMCSRSVLRKAVVSIYNDAVSNSRKEPSTWRSGEKETLHGPDTLAFVPAEETIAGGHCSRPAGCREEAHRDVLHCNRSMRMRIEGAFIWPNLPGGPR